MSVTDPLLKTLKLQILELHLSFQFLSADDGSPDGGGETVEGCSSSGNSYNKSSNNYSSDSNSSSNGVVAPSSAKRTSSSGDGSSSSSSSSITDAHPYLIPVCRTLEEVFRKGLVPTAGYSLLSLSVKKDDYWRWIENLPHEDQKIPPPLRAAVEAANASQRVLTYVGKGKLLAWFFFFFFLLPLLYRKLSLACRPRLTLADLRRKR